MRALIRNPDNSVRLQTTEDPVVSFPDEVKIRMSYCTLCRNDMRTADRFSLFGGYGIMGHEASGVIVGSGETARKNGFSSRKRVVIMRIDSCGTCKKA